MTPDNSGMPPLPPLARWNAADYADSTPVYDAREAELAMLAYGRQVAQMCAELCERFAERQMSPAECAAAIKHGFGLEKP